MDIFKNSKLRLLNYWQLTHIGINFEKKQINDMWISKSSEIS
jgi:hypothetical protein